MYRGCCRLRFGPDASRSKARAQAAPVDILRSSPRGSKYLKKEHCAQIRIAINTTTRLRRALGTRILDWLLIGCVQGFGFGV